MLQSSRLLLRPLEPGDLNVTYLSWLNDPAANRYLETRFLPQTLKSLQVYWQALRDYPSIPWFTICLLGERRQLGNIKVGPIQWLHRRAFEKCGFELESSLRQVVVTAVQRLDVWRLGLPRSNWSLFP